MAGRSPSDQLIGQQTKDNVPVNMATHSPHEPLKNQKKGLFPVFFFQNMFHPKNSDAQFDDQQSGSEINGGAIKMQEKINRKIKEAATKESDHVRRNKRNAIIKDAKPVRRFNLINASLG